MYMLFLGTIQQTYISVCLTTAYLQWNGILQKRKEDMEAEKERKNGPVEGFVEGLDSTI